MAFHDHQVKTLMRPICARFVLTILAAVLVPGTLAAAPGGPPANDRPTVSLLSSSRRDPYRGLFSPSDAQPVMGRPEIAARPVQVGQQAAVPAVAPIEYSHAYQTRLKIHKVASFAILPLFATELILGQSLYEDGRSGKKDAHVAVGVGIGTLFGINTVTGVWNLLESRKDPNGRKRRVIHSVLMLAADAGFAATAALAPDSEHGEVSDSRGAHRAAAITSIGLGTAGYLMMLFTK